MADARLTGARAAAGLFVITTAHVAFAFDGPDDTQAAPCRPTIACTADLVAPGAFELEIGGIYRSLGGGLKQFAVPFLAKLTAMPWLQLQVGSNGYTYEHGPDGVTYFDDVDLGAKFHLVDQSGLRPSLSASFAVAVPSDDMADHAEDYALLMTAYASKDLGPLHGDLNVGLNRLGLRGEPVDQAWVALALSTSLPRQFGAMVENYYFSPALPLATHDGGTLLALTYTVRRWLVVDAGADIGYFSSTRAYSVFAGMTVVPFVLFRPGGS
jgi:hypothetical protein